MGFDLDRFVEIGAGVHDGALDELRRGRKVGHWIWFVFPQIAGLGRSPTSRRYAIGSLAEARAYLAEPILGGRLRDAAAALLEGAGASGGRSAAEILGELDAMKVRSSMTLFHRAAPDELRFREVLDRLYEGRSDPATDAILGSASAADDG